MTLHEALIQGTKLLEDAGIAVPRLTAEVLLCHSIRCERPFLYARPEQELREVEWIHYGRYLHERLNGKPTQYITGRQEFYGREFRVTPDVLIPRQETELVVETALEVGRGARRILDVGSGSGAIAVTLQLETHAAVYGTDISAPALAVAAENARKLVAPVEFVCCDLMSAIVARSMDVIVSNPPYVPEAERASLQREVRDYEPEVALFAGSTGLEIYERLVTDAERVLCPGGWMVLELGYKSRDQVLGMFGSHWRDVRVVPDLAGIPRVLAARMEGSDNNRMKRRQILLDEESDRILEQLAQFHSGDRSLAIREALKMHENMAGMLDDLERMHAAELRRQKDRSEKSFRDGTAVPWDEVKRRCKL